MASQAHRDPLSRLGGQADCEGNASQPQQVHQPPRGKGLVAATQLHPQRAHRHEHRQHDEVERHRDVVRVVLPRLTQVQRRRLLAHHRDGREDGGNPKRGDDRQARTAPRRLPDGQFDAHRNIVASLASPVTMV